MITRQNAIPASWRRQNRGDPAELPSAERKGMLHSSSSSKFIFQQRTFKNHKIQQEQSETA